MGVFDLQDLYEDLYHDGDQGETFISVGIPPSCYDTLHL